MEASVMKGFVLGSVIGSVLVFLLWGGVAIAGGLDLGSAAAVGVFTTAWGGPGFGGMLGAVMGYVRHEEREQQEQRRPQPHRTETPLDRAA